MIGLFLLKLISIITARSAWSRTPILLVVTDIPDEEAVKFLQDSDIDSKTAGGVVNYLDDLLY